MLKHPHINILYMCMGKTKTQQQKKKNQRHKFVCLCLCGIEWIHRQQEDVPEREEDLRVVEIEAVIIIKSLTWTTRVATTTAVRVRRKVTSTL